MTQHVPKTNRVTDPHKIFITAVEFLTKVNPVIVDVGAGYLNETRYLLQKGYSVTAIDKNSIPEEFETLNQTKLNYVKCNFSDYDFKLSSIDFLVALHSLFFVLPQDFNLFFSRLLHSLTPGGIFVGDTLGIHDSWQVNGKRPMVFMTKEILTNLIKESGGEFEILQLQEREWDGVQYDEIEKHWHVIEFIVKRK